MIPMTKIHYFTRHQYGLHREFIVDPALAGLVSRLTGRKTITKEDRETITQLCAGAVQFEETIAPKN